MERRRGVMPVGNNMQNAVPNYQQLNLHQQPSFGSTDSADSNDSFRTQIPLPYHLLHDYQQNNNYTVTSGFASYAQTGSNGSSRSLNPTSSPYIPQGNTPTLPSAGFNAQGWGVPYTTDGHNSSITSSYQQQQPVQQSGGMQYQGGNPYQQQSGAHFGSAVGGMNPQNAFGIDVAPYGNLGAGVVALNNANQYNTAGGQMGFNSFASPNPGYTPTMPYAIGLVDQPANSMYNGSATNMYGNPNPIYNSQMPGSVSFPSASSNLYNSQSTIAASSFSSAPSNMYNNQAQGANFKSGLQNIKSSRAASGQSDTSTMRFQKKSFATSDGKESRNSHRSKTNPRSSNATPTVGGPVHAPNGARALSPEKLISKSTPPETSRTRKNTVVEDPTADSTLKQLGPSDTGAVSTHHRTLSKTPQLRSRRGQTITSATESRNQPVSEWAVGVRRSSEVGVLEELRDRGSPVKALSLVTLNDTDSFESSTVLSAPFDCMTPGRFTVGFGSGPLSQELLTLTHGGKRNPTLAEALDPYNVPFSEYCREAKSDNYGVIKIKNVGIRTHSQSFLPDSV